MKCSYILVYFNVSLIYIWATILLSAMKYIPTASCMHLPACRRHVSYFFCFTFFYAEKRRYADVLFPRKSIGNRKRLRAGLQVTLYGPGRKPIIFCKIYLLKSTPVQRNVFSVQTERISTNLIQS